MNQSLTAEDVGFAALTSSELSVGHGRRLAAVLDDEIDLDDGSALPLLWHWAYFALPIATAALGHDGHPRIAPGGPTSDLPRRMWAGGRVRRRAPLRLGHPATRRSRVTRAERKSGRSGELLVVTVEHEIEQGGQVALVEEQDLVYRAAPTEPMPLPEGGPGAAAPAGGWADVVTMDPVRLFRFSALTFNSHRIHYDQPYATGEEGYPGLVVHGPLTAILLAGAPFSLVGQPSATGVALQAIRGDSTVAMTATLAEHA